MKARTKIILGTAGIGFIAILIPAFLLNKWIEGIILFFAHWYIREQFPAQYHSVMPSKCRLITFAVYFFGVCFMLPISASFFSGIMLCYLIAAVGYIKHQADTYELKYRRATEPKPFNTSTCTRASLIARCNALHFSKANTDLAIAFFIDQTKQSEIADRLVIDEKSVQRRKMRMKRQLNT